MSVKKIFSSWSDQTGFPLLVVERNYKENNIKISQERYYNKYPYPETSTATWWIPYNFDTANNIALNNTYPDGWLAQGTKSALIEPAGNKKWTNDDWVLFNKQQTGYYRVLYDRRNYKMILRELNSGNLEKIHPLNRAQFFDDVADFVQTGRLPYDIYFDLVRYLKRETEFAPWSVALKSLLKTKRSLDEGSKAYEKLKKYVANIVKPFYESITFYDDDNEPAMKSFTREIAIKLACEFGFESCLDEAKMLLEESFVSENITFRSRNTRGSIYEFGIRTANSSLIERVWERLNSTKNSEERQEILNCFGNIADKTNLKEYLYKTIDSDNNLSRIDRVTLFIGIATKSQYGLLHAIDLLNNKVNETQKYLELNHTLPILASNINTNEAKNRVSIFFSSAIQMFILIKFIFFTYFSVQTTYQNNGNGETVKRRSTKAC